MIKIININKAYSGQTVLKNISFELKSGEYVGLIGPNGAGKSTLLKIILGIITPDTGKVIFSKKYKIGYVSQSSLPDLNFSISVQELLELELEKKFLWRRKSDLKRITYVLETVGLNKSILGKLFNSLSGGLKQRVIIAKSLLPNPNFLLFDEPFTGIDFSVKIKIYQLLSHLNLSLGITILFVSHEIESVINQCKKVLCLNKELHNGCHPIDFILGNTDNCNNSPYSNDKSIQTIHHHH